MWLHICIQLLYTERKPEHSIVGLLKNIFIIFFNAIINLSYLTHLQLLNLKHFLGDFSELDTSLILSKHPKNVCL